MRNVLAQRVMALPAALADPSKGGVAWGWGQIKIIGIKSRSRIPTAAALGNHEYLDTCNLAVKHCCLAGPALGR